MATDANITINITARTQHTPQEPRATQLRAEGAVYRGRLLRQPEGYDAEVWEHEDAREFSLGARLGCARYASATLPGDTQGRMAGVVWVFAPADITALRDRGLLPPLDSEGTPRPDWVGLGRWRAGRFAIDFDAGTFTGPGGLAQTLAGGWCPGTADANGYTPETESAPKGGTLEASKAAFDGEMRRVMGEPTGETADKLRAVGARYVGVYKGARFWESDEASEIGVAYDCPRWGRGADAGIKVAIAHCDRDCLIYPETAAAMRAAGLLSLGNGGEGPADPRVSAAACETGATRSPSPPKPSTPEHCYALDGPRRLPETPDTRSTALVSVEGGRLRLFLDPSETHTGLLGDREKRLEQWRSSIMGIRVPVPAATGYPVAFFSAWFHARTLDAEGWPTSPTTPAVQAIREAHRALEVALCEASKEGE